MEHTEVNFDLAWLATRNQQACQKRKQEKKCKEHDKKVDIRADHGQA